jgi:hypothetical protein
MKEIVKFYIEDDCRLIMVDEDRKQHELTIFNMGGNFKILPEKYKERFPAEVLSDIADNTPDGVFDQKPSNILQAIISALTKS